MANYPQELAQDAVCQSHTGHMTGLWFLPARSLRLNTNEWMNEWEVLPPIENSRYPLKRRLYGVQSFNNKITAIIVKLGTKSKEVIISWFNRFNISLEGRSEKRQMLDWLTERNLKPSPARNASRTTQLNLYLWHSVCRPLCETR